MVGIKYIKYVNLALGVGTEAANAELHTVRAEPYSHRKFGRSLQSLASISDNSVTAVELVHCTL